MRLGKSAKLNPYISFTFNLKMQLRQSKTLRMFDDHNGRVRHIDANLDHRRADEKVVPPSSKRFHRSGTIARPLASVHDADAERG